MRDRLSSEDFLKLSEDFWQVGPKVRYKNPDAWIAYLVVWRNLRELQNKNETTIVPSSCKMVKKTEKEKADLNVVHCFYDNIILPT